MGLRRVRAVLGTTIGDPPELLERGWAIYSGLVADPATYGTPLPALPAYKVLFDNATSAQAAVKKRAVGAAATRDAQCRLLLQGMKSECFYVQSLADVAASPEQAVALIQNAGLLVAEVPVRSKELLTLELGVPQGTVICDANVGLLVGVGALKPTQNRFFNWEYTLDMGKTFTAALSTSLGKTTLHNLPSLTLVGVRVSLTNAAGPGAWSQVVYIMVH